MQIDKSKILDMLKGQGDKDKADKADKELPDKVDTDKHSGMLSKLGIDVGSLTSKLPGGLGDKLGGLGG